MLRFLSFLHVRSLLAAGITLLGLMGCSASRPTPPTVAQTQPLIRVPGTPSASPAASPALALSTLTPPPANAQPFPVMLGIDVLEQQGFAAVRGKRIGLLTHPAGVNRRGESTIDVLRRAPGVKLVALYAVEHGIYNELPAEKPFPDKIDPRTGLMVFSLYSTKGKKFQPTPAQLKGIDALVIDLQDNGTRSYTFVGAMRTAMEACFANGKEVIVLDRPNPLGGLKVDGPPLDLQYTSDVGRFLVPYVHGLTIGELAHMAKETPHGAMTPLPDAVRQNGRLTVIPMRGWKRAMRWPETGLTFVPTSTYIQDFAACEGYPMTGLGCILGGFRNGVGNQHMFRGITHLTVKRDVYEKELRALPLHGLRFSRISVPSAKTGEPATGLFIEISDYDEWQATELNFWLMKLACKLEPKNPFATATVAQQKTFLVHVGSTALLEALRRDGAKVDIEAFLRDWQAKAKIFQQVSRKYWLYE
jgi:uncharacterized protein YbbC (DUF1343 family)